MTRIDVVQQIVDRTNARTYLEIGVYEGVSFMPIRVRRKIGVDPTFAISRKSRLKWLIKNRANWFAKFHRCTSDSYFARKKPAVRFDVVLIDGLHTMEQALRDVVNCLGSLNSRGAIVMHDCNPAHAAAACPAASWKAAEDMKVPGWNAVWTGDVWKTICHLRSQRDDVKVFVLDCDFGLGIITRGTPHSRLDLSGDELRRMTYEDLARDRKRLLDLKDESCFSEFIETL
jgi:hypothetical protein